MSTSPTARPSPVARKGRGAGGNPESRFEAQRREAVDDGWGGLEALALDPPPPTEIIPDRSRSVIATNDSPDIPFERSINPYRGCEHGCIYCYARPSHGFLGLSPGLDFETRILAKHDAPALLRKELARPGYDCRPIALGTNTDVYQPIERRLAITRGLIEVLAETRHPLSIVTKSALVLRDLDLLADMARDGLVKVFVSVTTLDPALARRMEPRAAAPHRRLATIAALREAGVPVGVMVAPIIPALNDHEIERILEAAAGAGAGSAGWVMLRLPHEVRGLFLDWLQAHHPLRAAKVLAHIQAVRGGRLNDPQFGSRMRGQGPQAALIARRFALASRRHGLDRPARPTRTDHFRPPPANPDQLDLFG
jgi:DNA repair photolyase